MDARQDTIPADLWDSRSRLLLGEDAVKWLASSSVTVIGTGGVGGYAVEALARTGIGHLRIVDADKVSVSNINRQLVALHSTVGLSKVELFARRCLDINPDIRVEAIEEFITPENASSIIGDDCDYVVDAIDTVAPKMAVITHCLHRGIPVISSMGAGGRTDPTKIIYCDISETRDDGLARAVRQRLKKAGIRRKLKVVASTEPPHAASVTALDERNKRSSYGTIFPIPAIFGIYLASHVITQLAKENSRLSPEDKNDRNIL